MASTTPGMSRVNPGPSAQDIRLQKYFWYPSIKIFVYRSILREKPRPAAVRESRCAPWLVVGVVCFGAFMGQLDASIITITFPAMERDCAVPGLGLPVFVPANNTVTMRSTDGSSASLLGGLVNMARGIGTTLGISLMALALHLGGAGHGYAGSTQARPAFIVLAVAAAAAAAIALTSRAQPRGQAGRPREADPSGAYG
jgi:hypothetical protein